MNLWREAGKVKMNKRKTGTAYEVIAADYLKKQGVQIIEMNYRISRGEIDIIGKEKDTLVFIEVKYRKNASYGYPWEAISVEKQKKSPTTHSSRRRRRDFSKLYCLRTVVEIITYFFEIVKR